MTQFLILVDRNWFIISNSLSLNQSRKYHLFREANFENLSHCKWHILIFQIKLNYRLWEMQIFVIFWFIRGNGAVYFWKETILLISPLKSYNKAFGNWEMIGWVAQDQTRQEEKVEAKSNQLFKNIRFPYSNFRCMLGSQIRHQNRLSIMYEKKVRTFSFESEQDIKMEEAISHTQW